MKRFETIHSIRRRSFLFAVETSLHKDDYQKYEDLRQEIWREPTDKMAGVRNMLCENYFDKGSSLFTGVFKEERKGDFPKDADHLVGFSYGFVGVRDKTLGFGSSSNLIFYSQYLGVKKGYRDLGLGILIKKFQKDIVKEVFGIDTITCTYDPLVGVNAYRNIHYFGMEVLGYKVAYYQEFGGELNRVDVPCDRLYVSWALRGHVQREAYELENFMNTDHLAVDAEMIEVRGHSGLIRLETVANVRLDLNREIVLLEIPADFYFMLKETDVADEKVRNIPLVWRIKTREVFQTLLERKYRIIDFKIFRGEERMRDFYVLKR
jgi:predicted GNAT superfamily acetyltransferase